MLMRSKAPLRISFAGGGTDVPPYSTERGGCVLSTTIDKHAYGSLRLRDGKGITIHSLDYDIVAKYVVEEDLEYDGKLDLVKAVIRHMNGHINGKGLEIYLHNDAPPGSGLGSSSTLVVALLGLFKHWLHLPLTDYEMADLAYRIERVELGIEGGLQDQYAAVFGGFNFIEFYGPTVIVNPLRISPAIWHELEYCLLLCYTGKTRRSDNIIKTMVTNYEHGREDTIAALDQLKEIAVQMKNALLRGRLDDFGALLHEGWLCKKRTARKVTNPHIDTLYEAARRRGALGGKLLGAGGGGYLLLHCPFDRKHLIAEELERLGGQVVKFAFEQNGLETWEVR